MTGKPKYHVGGDIDDATVCSEECIKDYSKKHPYLTIVLYEVIS
jgi:hypothetical protein